MELYIIYLRKSQMDRDFEELSVEETLKRHEKTLTEFCINNNLAVDVVLKEVVSGESLTSRPQMMKLLELINTGKYAGVVCMDIDRLSRGSSMDSGYITQVLQVNNCKIVTPVKTYDLNDESDEQFTDMKFMFSRYEHKVIKKRLIAGRNASAAEGKYLGSKAPFGYKIVKLKGVKGNTLEIIPEEARIVKLIFNLYTEENMGSRSIAWHLNKLHLKTKTGVDWTETSVTNVLTNEVYYGKNRWKRHQMTKKFEGGKIVKKNVREKQYELYDGLHEPIITEEQFYLVKKMRSEKYHPPAKIGTTLANPFAELMYCENCGGRVALNTYGTKRKTKPRYRCLNQGKTCDCKDNFASEIEDAIVAEMKKWLNGYLLSLDSEPVKQDNGLELALEQLKKQLEDLYEQQETICIQLEKKVYSPQLFAKRNAAIESEISTVTSAIADLEEQLILQENDQIVKGNIIPSTQYLLDSYADMTPKEKNELWKQVLEKITYYKKERGGEFTITIYPKLPYNPPQN